MNLFRRLWRWAWGLAPQYLRYAITGALGTGISMGLLYALTEWGGLWYMVSAVLATVVASFWNFFGNRTWTFGVGKEKHPLSMLESWIRRMNGHVRS